MARLTILSCVGGGPMQRLVQALRAQGQQAELWAGQDPEAWRIRMATRGGRARARLDAFVGFPLRSLARSLNNLPQTLIPTTNPFFLPALLVLSKALHGKTVVPLLYDMYPDTLEATGLSATGGLTSRLGAQLNRWLLAHADGVVFIGDHMARHAIERYGTPRRWRVLWTGASLAEHQRAHALSKSGNGHIVLSYVGNLGLVHDWDTVAQGLGPMLGDGLRFVCAASGPGVKVWQHALADLPAGWAQFEAPLLDQAWLELLDRSSVALVTLRSTAAHTSVPSKTFSAMAAGCAILAVAPEASDLAALVRQHGCGLVVEPGDVNGFQTAMRKLVDEPATLSAMQNAARQAVTDHYDIPVLASTWRQFLDEVERQPAYAFGLDALKRGLDLSASAAGLVALSPLLAATALALRLTIGSPVLFAQQRPGRHGRPFKLYKFRTMRHARPGEDGPEHDAARLTRLGTLLRATSIDELPTLLNVLWGDMSLVGPRPLLMRYLERYTTEQARRHAVKPGITGWAQVNGRNALSWEQKFAHDVWYVDHRSLLLDLKILAMTVHRVLRRQGISAGDHATMPEFMGSSTRADHDARVQVSA